MNVHVKWAPNTAEALGRSGESWEDVELVEEGGRITLYRDDPSGVDQLVASFGRHDAEVLVTE